MFRRLFKIRDSRKLRKVEAENELLKRQLAIAQAEVESLALVLSRDRERIKSELASYAKVTAGNA